MLALPATILIDNCTLCNLKCSVCDHKNFKKRSRPTIMPMELYEKIILEIAQVAPNTRVWEIYFGDPFLCKDMAFRVAKAKGAGLTDVVLNTNGVLMTKIKGKALALSGLDALYVGIDAVTEETYNKIRCGGDYHKVVYNVLKYREAIKDGQDLFVQFVESDINRHELDEFKAFWAGHGVAVKTRTMLSWAGLVETGAGNQDMARQPCRWNTESMSICSDGQVAWCAVDLHCRMPAGNVHNTSLVDIWNKGPLAEARKEQHENRFENLPQICRNCSDWKAGHGTYN